MPFCEDLSPWLSWNVDRDWINENVKWRDFGTGVRLGKLAKEGNTVLINNVLKFAKKLEKFS